MKFLDLKDYMHLKAKCLFFSKQVTAPFAQQFAFETMILILLHMKNIDRICKYLCINISLENIKSRWKYISMIITSQ